MLRVNLRTNRILRRFGFDVDFAELDILPPFLHKTLTSISSPHFSEFSLRLLGGLVKFNLDRSRRHKYRIRTWGAGWDVIDEDLYAHAAGRDDFRFTIEFVAGRSTEAAIEARFPRMKSNGSLVIIQRQPR